MFPMTAHVEAVALLTRSNVTQWALALGRDVQELERSEEWLKQPTAEAVALLIKI